MLSFLQKKPIEVAGLTEKELNAELEKGYMDFNQGNMKPVDKAFSEHP